MSIIKGWISNIYLGILIVVFLVDVIYMGINIVKLRKLSSETASSLRKDYKNNILIGVLILIGILFLLQRI